jgi:hypothetical protein
LSFTQKAILLHKPGSQNTYYSLCENSKGELNMERNYPRTLTLDERLNHLNAKITDIERRVIALERNLATAKPVAKPPTQHAPTSPQTKNETGHKYLGRAISMAKRDYERKYK